MFVDEPLKFDKEILMATVKSKGYCIQFVPKDLIDLDIIINVV